MGEYIKHPNVEGNEIKIGVCRGSNRNEWETWFAKDVLVKLERAGFQDWYAGEFDERDITLIDFIEGYSEMNTSMLLYPDMNAVLKEYPEYKDILTEK